MKRHIVVPNIPGELYRKGGERAICFESAPVQLHGDRGLRPDEAMMEKEELVTPVRSTRSSKLQPNRLLSAMQPGDVRLFDPPAKLDGIRDTGRGLSSEQTAKYLGVTHQAVSQLTRKALHKFRFGLEKLNREIPGILDDHDFPKMFYHAMQELTQERYAKK